jgi:hypothetical protein
MRKAAAALALVLMLDAPAFGHALDEYVQATLISLERNHIDLKLRLEPGVDVFPKVFAAIDTDADGVLSEREKQAYARRVVGDLALSVDGRRVAAEIESIAFPAVDLMKEGIGEIQITLRASVAGGSGPAHKLVLENHHQRSIAAYLVNSLTPRDPSLHIVSQHRSADQARYELDYTT